MPYGPMGMGKIGNRNNGVGVAEGNKKMGGIKINPGVDVAEGIAVGAPVLEGTAVGTIGVGGAAMEASVAGIQSAEVTEPAIHAKPPLPPANSMYHHVPS